MNQASGGDGIPVELFQILKDDAASPYPQKVVKGEQERKVFRELFFLGVQKIKESIEQCPVLVSRLSFLGLMFQGLIVFHVNNSRHSLVCYARMIKGGRSCIAMPFFYY